MKTRGGRQPQEDVGEIAVEVLAAADAALNRLEASLSRAHDLPNPRDKRDVSAALFGVRQRLRDVLPELRLKLTRAPTAGPARLTGSGG